MGKINEGYLLLAISSRSRKANDRLVEYGTIGFTTTGTTVEIPTNLSVVEYVAALPKTVTYNVNDQLSSDGVVTTGAVTLARNASGTSGLEAYYELRGYRFD